MLHEKMVNLLNSFFDHYEDVTYYKNKKLKKLSSKKLQYITYNESTNQVDTYSFSKDILAGYVKYNISLDINLSMDKFDIYAENHTNQSQMNSVNTYVIQSDSELIDDELINPNELMSSYYK